MYTPNPIDTKNIVLDGDILALSEILARNTHEVWAAGRIAEGWSYGKVRDDTKKQHPCLVPYEELPEPEREYDRATSLETLKAILNDDGLKILTAVSESLTLKFPALRYKP